MLLKGRVNGKVIDGNLEPGSWIYFKFGRFVDMAQKSQHFVSSSVNLYQLSDHLRLNLLFLDCLSAHHWGTLAEESFSNAARSRVTKYSARSVTSSCNLVRQSVSCSIPIKSHGVSFKNCGNTSLLFKTLSHLAECQSLSFSLLKVRSIVSTDGNINNRANWQKHYWLR
jgi:hypothetical protein